MQQLNHLKIVKSVTTLAAESGRLEPSYSNRPRCLLSFGKSCFFQKQGVIVPTFHPKRSSKPSPNLRVPLPCMPNCVVEDEI